MRTTTRRRLDVLLIGAGGAAAAGVAALGSVAFNEERIEQMWLGASLRPDGTAALHEVIDDNFGVSAERHGLFRTIPGLTTQSPVQVHSPTGAPDGINSIVPSEKVRDAVDIRIGDATKMVTGRHRYVIDYSLSTLASGAVIGWNAVGTYWELPIEETEIHLVAPWRLTDVVCQEGRPRSTEHCEIDQVEPGHLVVRVHDRIEPGHGITIRAVSADGLAATPALPPDPPIPADHGAGIAKPAGLAALAALVGGLVTSRLVRRAGRERVGVGGPTDAAFADSSGGTAERRVDTADLKDLATTDFAPPEGVTAPMGGLVLAESVRPEHKVAWLLEAAIAGVVDLDDTDGQLRLTRSAPGDAETADVLDTAFGRRDAITLGTYDKTFAKGWGELGTKLEEWSASSGLWDPAGDRRKLRARVLGVLAAILGVIGLGVTAALAGRYGGGWVWLLAGAAVVAGAGYAAALRGWELRVRTPQGSALWLRVESFRRFLHESEAFHAEEAAKRGVLREYTAWAMALGEIDRWKRAVEGSTVIPDTAGLHYLAMAPLLSSSTSSASTAPSSSGGGGGGGVGGGGGGGGGGNW